MKRIIISGGGTGGHIYPAITIYKELKELTDAEFLYIGAEGGLESTLIPKEGIPFVALPTQGLQRKLSLDAFITMGKAASSVWKARKLIQDFKPDVVIGTGGYVCGPVLMAAALMKIPTLIQEQNVVPGITNRILSKFVDVVAVGYEAAVEAFKAKQVVYTGNPVRPEVMAVSREEGRNHFQLEEEVFTVLIAGGSRGARSINTAMIDVHSHFKGHKGIKLIHITGQGEYGRVIDSLGVTNGDTYSSSSMILPYLHDMPKALSAADLAVFRAGAIGLAEIGVRGLPSVLIPYPYAAEDHQTFNAQVFVKAGAAHMIEDKALNGKALIEEIEYFMSHKDTLIRMGKEAHKLGNPKAARQIGELALSLIK